VNEARGHQHEALALFDALVDLDATSREARLAAAEPTVAALVRRWLDADASHDARVTPLHYAELATAARKADATPGERIGAWSLVREIGRGGMGSVWLAERAGGDFTQKVALKLIRRDLGASDAEARFRRERRILATLKHPNIAALLDGGVTADGRPWLAMEWVEGRTLREALAERPLEPPRLVVLATALSSALAHAHAAGVVHRDLKPENVMLAREGYAKVLDFGVAKLIADDARATGATETQPGRVIGTTPYMSPEQAAGEPVDFRSDQFALGAVLYEAATGRAAFSRDTPAETIAAVLRDTPPLGTALGDALPPAFARIVERCLAKDPEDRYASTQDLARDFADLTHAPARRVRMRPVLVRRVATMVLALAAIGASWWIGRGMRDTARPRIEAELAIAPAEKLWFGTIVQHAFTISPDGRRLAYVGQRGPRERLLYVRDFGERRATPLPGTEFPTNPAFSPDGEWIAYFAGGFEMRKVPARGGSSTVVAQAPNNLGGLAWPTMDRIIFSRSPATGLWEVSPNGGEPRQITFPDFDAGEEGHVWPVAVPGTSLLLYVSEIESADTFDAARIYAYDEASGKRTLLLEGGSDPGLRDGTLYYARAGTVYSVGFDADRVALRGSPRPVWEGVIYSIATGAAQYALGPGVSVHAKGAEGWDLIDPVIVDRTGKAESLGLPPRNYARARVSPDGRRAAFQIAAADDDIWIYDFERRAMTRFTDRHENIFPMWSRDGQWIIWSRHRQPPPTLWRQRADGSGEPEQLTSSPDLLAQLAEDVTPDDRTIVYDQYKSATDFDIGFYDFATKTTRLFNDAGRREMRARVSPNGRWLAFRGGATGRDEVYVQALEADTRRWQLSTAGGADPVWSPDGREVFFSWAGVLYSVPVSSDADDLAPGAPRKLFDYDFFGGYDVFPDGQRFLMRRRIPEPGGAGPLLVEFD